MVVQLTPERDFLGPGCGDRCEIVRAIVPGRFGRSELLLHDPESHERYGRVTAGEASIAGDVVIRTGGLMIDRWQRKAFGFGVDLLITGGEWKILDYLTVNARRYCPSSEIAHAVWDEWTDPHNVHVYMMRLRSRLGACAELIETRHAHGYRLRLDPPIACAPVPLPPRRWARFHNCCVCCGKTTYAHGGKGRCVRCRTGGGKRSRHFGPCGAPPEVMP